MQEIPGRPLHPEDLRLLALIAEGASDRAIATTLNTSVRAVRQQARSACDLLGCGTRIEAVVSAVHRGLI